MHQLFIKNMRHLDPKSACALTSDDLQRELQRFGSEILLRELNAFEDRLVTNLLKKLQQSGPVTRSSYAARSSMSRSSMPFARQINHRQGSFLSDSSSLEAEPHASFMDAPNAFKTGSGQPLSVKRRQTICTEDGADIAMHRLRKGFWVDTAQPRNSYTYAPLEKPSNGVFWRNNIYKGFRVSRLKDMLEGEVFSSIIGAMLLANFILIGLETETAARRAGKPITSVFDILENTFCIFFVVEIGVRLAVYRGEFFCMSDYVWNIFDLLVVGIQVADVIARFYMNLTMPSTAQFRILRLARLFRMMRVLRACRILRHVKEMRLLISSTIESFRPLKWMVMLLTAISSMFAIMVTQIVTDYRASDLSAAENATLELYYGSLSTSMLSLYQVISEGIHWKDLLQPLTKFCSPWIQVLFVCYIGITVLAMMNLITGIFVDSVSRTAEHSKKRMLAYQMQVLFEGADTDHSGLIDFDKFSTQLKHPQMQSYLKEVDLNDEDAKDLFKLLDVEGAGSISLDGWVSGCLTLTGQAKALDLATVLRELRMFFRLWQEHADAMETTLDWITR